MTSETLEVVHVGFRPHDHLEGGDDFVAGRAVAGGAEQPAEEQSLESRALRLDWIRIRKGVRRLGF